MRSDSINIGLLDCPGEFVEVARSLPPRADCEQKFTVLAAVPGDEKFDLLIAGREFFNNNRGLLDSLAASGVDIVALDDGEGTDYPPILTDVWRAPMSGDELAFRLGKWRKNHSREDELWKTSHFLDSLLAASPNLIWFKTRDGIHSLVNDSFCRAVNKPMEDILGKTHAYIWDVDDDDPACVESERKVEESGRVQVSDEEIVTGDGKRLLRTYKAPVRDRDGSFVGSLGIGVDITRERAYYDRLARNSAALESIFTNMDCGIISHTLDGEKIVSVNKAALRLLGYATREEIEGDGFNMVAGSVIADDQPRVREAIAQLRKEGESVNYEYRVCHPDGKIYYVMGNAKLVEKDGELICQRLMMDCTSQKLAEEKEQMEKEKRNLNLIRALSVDYQLVFVEDPATGSGTVLQLKDDADEAVRRIFTRNAPISDLVREYIDTRVHPDDRERLSSALSPENLLSKLSEVDNYYINYRVPDGDDVQYFQVKAVLAGDLNDMHGLVVGLQSIDSRVRQEMEQKNKLADALKAARKASTAKSIFLSNMSHDIRTPMNAVIGYTSLALAHAPEKGAVRNYLEKILSSGNHLISLINNILDMSHIESGKIQLDVKPWDLASILRELWNLVHPAAEAKNQTLTFNVDHVRDTVILCDKLRLNQLLLNLLSNSVKYTPNGGRVEMSVEETPGEDEFTRFYEFRVRDNGIGMSEEFLTRIFEPFERAQTSTIAGIEGTGLGMAITRSIGEIMGGKIEVKSKVGEGTEFIFRVPLRLAEAEDLLTRSWADEETAENSEKHKAPDTYQGSILLTEDNPMNQEIAYEFLTSAGYNVEIANNGREAVDMLLSGRPGQYDVVLMDVQMPVLDGYDATELIRALPDPQLARIPIIAMTANSFEEDKREALRRGMNDHIAKPIDFQILFRTLDGILKI